MAVTPEDIQKLEEAMQFFGVEGIIVDGDASDLAGKLAPFLDRFSRAFPSVGAFGQGEKFAAEDIYNAETRDAQIEEISANVEAFKNSPQIGLVHEILSSQPNYQNIQSHLTTMGVENPSDIVEKIARGLGSGFVTPQQILYGGGLVKTQDSIMARAQEDPNFSSLGDILGGNALSNVERTIKLLEGADTWFDVIEEIKPEPKDPEEAAQLGAANEAAEEVAKAEAAAAALERIKVVEQAIGIETLDGVWGEAEQDALRAHIQTLQNGEQGSAWEGAKNGFYSKDFAEYAAGNLSSFDTPEKRFFEQLIMLERDGVDLVDENDLPINSEEVKGSIVAIEEMLRVMTPYVQEQLDLKRERPESIIRAINEGKASELEISAALKVLADPNSPEEHKLEAQEYVDSLGFDADDIGEFLDGFIGLGDTEFGRDLVEKGKNVSIEMIRGRLASYNDLPVLNPDNFGDGRLDIHEQTALQGVLFLMADRLGVPGKDNWQYTPELGEAIIAKLPSLPVEQKEELVALVPMISLPANYAEMSAEEKNATLNSEITKGVGLFVEQMNIADRAGVLTKGRLYLSEEVQIPKLTKEIFTEFMDGKRDELNPHYHAARATPIERNMLNLMVHEFTEGLDLADLMGEGFDPLEVEPMGTDAEAIAARFTEMYPEGADIDFEQMGKMLETLPFGTDTRRQMFRDLLEKMEKEEAEGTTIAVLATMFGEGISAINANSEAGSDYLYIEQRPITIDPRLSDFSFKMGDQDVTAEEVFKLHKADNNNFHVDTRYQPTYFRDESGEIYVAALDVQSRVFQIEKLDLEHWREVLAHPDNAQRPGERDVVHGMRLNEALQDVSGYNLIFQNMYDRDLQASFGGSFRTFPSEAFENSVPSYSDLNTRVGGVIAAREAEAAAAALKAATPGNSSVIEKFGDAAEPAESYNSLPRAESLNRYSRNPVDTGDPAAALSHDGVSGPGMQAGTQGD